MERLWKKVNRTAPGGCWLWTAYCTQNGYGQIAYQGKVVYAHRLIYELLVGPIPPGMTIDHLCRVKACVNPDHLEVVTTRENILRGTGPTARQARQTHCIHGHPLEGDNLYVDPRGRRGCRICNRAHSKRWAAAQKVGK